MKRFKMNKFLALILALVMMVSVVMPVSIFAEDEEIDGSIEIMEIDEEIKDDLSNVDENIDTDSLDLSKNVKDVKLKTETSEDYEYTVLDDGTAALTKYNGTATKITFPTTIDGLVVSRIQGYNGSVSSKSADYANYKKYSFFKNASKIKSVVIPDSITDVGKYIFNRCTSLENLTIPCAATNVKLFQFARKNNYDGDDIYLYPSIYEGSIKNLTITGTGTIGDAFDRCYSLRKVKIRDGVTGIGNCAFILCAALESISIPNSVKSIGNNAFSECASLKSISIPESVRKIGDRAFSECYKLNSIKISDGVTSIGVYAFMDCRSLKNVILPNSMKKIPREMFSLCTSLDTINIPDGVEKIGDRTFFNCTSLKVLILPDSITQIEPNSFYQCSNLTLYAKNSYVKEFCKKHNINCIPYSKFIEASSINVEDESVSVGGNAKVKSTIYPKKATVKKIRFISSNKKVATLSSNGKIKAKKVGKIKVTAMSLDGKRVKTTATIIVNPTKVKGVKIQSSYRKATLSFNKAKGAKKYEIYRSTNKNSGFKKVRKTSKRKWTDKKVKSGKTYYYKVRAVHGKYKGKFSKVQEVRVW